MRSQVALVGVGEERPPSGEKLEEQDAGRVHIAPRIHGPGLHLLGGHISRRSEHDPGARQVLGHGARARALEKLRHAEVEQPHVIRLVRQLLQEHVGGFQIAVDDPLAVREGQPAQRLPDDVQRPPERQRSFLEQRPQRLALQELHHQKRHAAVDSEIGHRNDVGMGQRRQRLGLPLETAAPLRDAGRILVEHLDRHEPPEVRLSPPVDDPHAAFAEAPEHLVASVQRPSNERIGLWIGLGQIDAHWARL